MITGLYAIGGLCALLVVLGLRRKPPIVPLVPRTGLTAAGKTEPVELANQIVNLRWRINQ